MLRSALLYVALAGGGFVAVALGLRQLVPWPAEYGLHAKFEHFAEHVEDYDAVFLGSSHVWRGVDPAIVDAKLEEKGLAFNSFNLGVGGSRIWEWDYLLHEVLALEPERLRWIFFEGAPWDPTFPSEQFAYSFRTVHWHTPTQTRKALAATWKADLGPREKLDVARTHVQLLLWNLTNYGQGRRIALDLIDEPVIDFGFDQSPEEYVKDEGWQPELKEVHPAFAKEHDEYAEKIARIEAETDVPVDIEHVYLAGLEQQVSATDERGIRLVHVTMPGDAAIPEIATLNAAGHVPLLFDFNRPERFPFLFDVETRFSSHHLNRLGARRLSIAMANRIAREMDAADEQ